MNCNDYFKVAVLESNPIDHAIDNKFWHVPETLLIADNLTSPPLIFR
ncbi:MAG: hypothetical protein QX196_02590 [Methylococcaceae bacterium]